MRLLPTRQGLRWFMAGLGVVILLYSSITSVVLQIERGADLHRELVGQRALIAAGKEQAAFAVWLIESIDALYQCSHMPVCPPLPPLPKLPGVTS